MLLLTATPISNKLTDLYSIVDIVRPHLLGSVSDFEQEYVLDPGTARTARPARVEQLREIVGSVMCRTRRSDTNIAFTRRYVKTSRIAASRTSWLS